MRVLVTGAAGFIGTHVVRRLQNIGHEVIGLDLMHPAAHRDRSVPAGVQFGDVRDPDSVARSLRGVDAVVHLASMVGLGVDLDDLPEYVSCNDLGTATLLAAMARSRVDRLVLASSMVVYGEGAYRCATHGRARPAARRTEDLVAHRFEPRCVHCGQILASSCVVEDDALEPRSVYAATKLAQEHLSGVWARETGGVVAALRFHNVYGPGMPRDTPYAGVAAIFRSALERGEPPHVYEDGAQRRDFVHVTDVARATLLALDALTGGRMESGTSRAFNIASGEPRTVGDLAHVLAGAYGGPPPVITGEFRAGDVRHVVASPARAARELDFTATVPFDDGIREFAAVALRA